MTAEQPESRAIRLQVEVPGTAQEVWESVATGPGIASWFVPAEVAEREGGRIALEFGPGMTEIGEVTVWQPPHRFAYVVPAQGDRRLAYEWLVEARAGGTCLVRLVNSGFGPDADWDAEYDGMERGWTMFLQMLRLARTHFPGRPCTPVHASAMLAAAPSAAWLHLTSALGMDLELPEHTRVHGAGGPQPLSGQVEWASPEMRLIRLDAPATGLVLVAAEPVHAGSMLSVWLYPRDDGVDGDAWRAWMTERFPVPDHTIASASQGA